MTRLESIGVIVATGILALAFVCLPTWDVLLFGMLWTLVVTTAA